MAWLALVPVLWFLQNVQHEGCHALAVLLCGGKVTRFVPWPGRMGGSWTLAHVDWSLPSQPTRFEVAMIYAAPQLANTLILALATIGMCMSHALFFLGPALLNFADGAFNLSTFARRKPVDSDGWRWQAAMGGPIWMARVAAATWVTGWGASLAYWAHGAAL